MIKGAITPEMYEFCEIGGPLLDQPPRWILGCFSEIPKAAQFPSDAPNARPAGLFIFGNGAQRSQAVRTKRKTTVRVHR